MKRILTVIVPLLAVALLVGACSGGMSMGGASQPSAATNATPVASAGTIQVIEPWARAAAGGGNGAAYIVLKNGGSADRLLSAKSDVAKSVELHTMEMKDNTMQMRPVDGIDVPANGQVELKPGGFHVMLIGLNKELKPNDTFTLKLQFEKAGPVDVNVQVRQPQ